MQRLTSQHYPLTMSRMLYHQRALSEENRICPSAYGVRLQTSVSVFSRPREAPCVRT